jgi:rfaE bifunctional protein nucleotidyltransferase chain/domain
MKTATQFKIVDRSGLKSIVERLRGDGQRVVLTNGCFDLIHTGHTRYLEAARAAGDCLVVAVNSDDSVRQLKGSKRPIIPLEERMEILAGFAFVDWVVAFSERDPYRLIEEVRPSMLVKGGDWPLESIIGRDLVMGDGGSVFTIPKIEGRSTSAIIELIAERYARDRD